MIETQRRRRSHTASPSDACARLRASDIAAGVLIAILYWARVVFITAITAVILALILEPFVGLLIRLRFPRVLATLMVGLIAALVLYLAGLAAWNQISGIARRCARIQGNLSGFITGVADRITESGRRHFAPADARPKAAGSGARAPAAPAARAAATSGAPSPLPVSSRRHSRRFASMKTATRSPTTSMPASGPSTSSC